MSEAVKYPKCEIWGTSFSDAGEDFCEVRPFGKDGTPGPKIILPGY